MRLKNLKLHNFRNITHLNLSFDQSDLIIFSGQNAQGKTNILESIYFLICAKSFRTNDSADLIRCGQQSSVLKAEFGWNKHSISREITLNLHESHGKNIRQDHKHIKIAEFVQQIPVVLFFPEDLHYMNTHAAYRRRYLDRILSQIDKKYLFHRTRLNQVLRQRNAILKSRLDANYQKLELDIWDEKLITHSMYITEKRFQLVNTLNQSLPESYQTIACSKEIPSLSYKPSFIADNQQHWQEALHKARSQDMLYRSTSIGPHRDDLKCELNQQKLSQTASRGEHRSYLLSLKKSEISHLKQVSGKKPIILLDDVFSELDQLRQSQLLPLIKNHQSFITTNQIPAKIKPESTVYQVVNGTVL